MEVGAIAADAWPQPSRTRARRKVARTRRSVDVRALPSPAAMSEAIVIAASGRDDWIGWLELKREAVSAIATRNTARVIGDLDADVLAVIEAEDRPALVRFNKDVFGAQQAAKPTKAEQWKYRHVMS